MSETTIWRNFKFVRFFSSFTIGNIGDWFDIFALQIIFVHEWQASPMLMGVLILFYFLPAILLGPIAGVWADRVSQRNLMLVTDGLAATLGTLSSGFFVLWFGIRKVYLGLAVIMLILAIASLIFIHK